MAFKDRDTHVSAGPYGLLLGLAGMGLVLILVFIGWVFGLAMGDCA